jgi:hypothetical protein
MGLDMYLNGTDRGEQIQLGYWRKHPNLHGYVVREYASGVDECQEIPLDVEDLKMILVSTLADQLPDTKGFFFGETTLRDKHDTVEIVSQAIAWLELDPRRKVHYRASW